MSLRTKLIPAPVLVLGVLPLLSACSGGEPGAPMGQDGAHEHGVADVSIVVEGTLASVIFQAPSGDILGYEGGEPGEEELEAARVTLRGLETNLLAMLGVPDELECRVAEVSWEGAAYELLDPEGDLDGPDAEESDATDEHGDEDHEDEGHEGDADSHSEVIGEFSVECESPLEGATLELAFSDYFDGIEEVDLQAVSTERQVGRRIPASGSVLDL